MREPRGGLTGTSEAGIGSTDRYAFPDRSASPGPDGSVDEERQRAAAARALAEQEKARQAEEARLQQLREQQAQEAREQEEARRRHEEELARERDRQSDGDCRIF